MDQRETQSPLRETLPSADVFEKYSHIPGSTPREKLRNAWAQMKAKQDSALLQGARVDDGVNASSIVTPSPAGDIEPSVPVPLPVTMANLSGRPVEEAALQSAPEVSHPLPESLVASASLTHSEVEPLVQTIQPLALTATYAAPQAPGSVQLGPSEFAITLPMDSRMKDEYQQVLSADAKSIAAFLSSFRAGSSPEDDEMQRLTSRVQKVVELLNNITTHPDLNMTHHLPESPGDLEGEASWAQYSSAKFLFLGNLINMASPHNLHLIIMAQGGKTLEIVERYLLGKGFAYTRPRQEMGSGTSFELSMAKGSLSFGVHPTQNEGLLETYKFPSVVIALDSSFDAQNPSIQHIRSTFAKSGHLLPVIRLLVSNTSEHLMLCIPEVPESQRLRLLIHHVLQLQDIVGDLQDDALNVQEDAEEVTNCLLADAFHSNWPIALIEPLNIAVPEELDALLKQPASDNDESLSGGDKEMSSLQPLIPKRVFVSFTKTRHADLASTNGMAQDPDDAIEHGIKRQRMGSSQDPSQLTESTAKFPSQTLNGDLQNLERSLMHQTAAHQAELERLQSRLDKALAELKDKDRSLGELQHRYETRTNEVFTMQRERGDLVNSRVAAEQKAERLRDDNNKLKDERSELKKELDEARQALKAGGGSMAELESVREEVRRLSKENASLERKTEYEKKQAEYTREQYQNASTAAAQSGLELRQLQEELEALRKKADGEAARLRELNMKSDSERHLARIAELEATLASREDLLRRKEDELREIRKNRPATRATSTPRSPKWGPNSSRPTSPGINNGNNGSSLAARASSLRFSSEAAS